MNQVTADEFKSSLLKFFNSSEEIIKLYGKKPRLIFNYSKSGNDWIRTFKQVSNWGDLRRNEEFKAKIFEAEEIEDCLDKLDSILIPRNLIKRDANKNEIPIKEKKIKEENRKWNQSELFNLFIDFKELQELHPEISTEKFVEYKSNELFSKECTFNFRALLIGFITNEVKTFKIGDYEIRELKVEEKLEMMNNIENGHNYKDPISIAIGYNDTMPYKYWFNGKIKFDYDFERDSIIIRKPKDIIKSIELEISIILQSFRLYNSIEVGIREYYIKPVYINNCEVFQKWDYEEYKYADFGKFEKVQSRAYSKGFFQNFNYKFVKSDIPKINIILNKIEIYNKNPLAIITQAINDFSNSFEQNHFVFTFILLIKTFESLVNDPQKIKINKDEILEKIDDIRSKIEGTNNINKIRNLLVKLNLYPGINKAIQIGKRIYSTDKNEQKQFNIFFQNNSEDKCYRIRNNLFHGNLANEIEKKIIKVLPQLSIYVRELLKKIIDLRIEGKLSCDNSGYYNKLQEISKGLK